MPKDEAAGWEAEKCPCGEDTIQGCAERPAKHCGNTKTTKIERWWVKYYADRPPKFHEGWDLHRRGFPYSALVSWDAKRGWDARDSLGDQV